MIKVVNVCAKYDADPKLSNHILNKISFNVAQGEIIGVLGRNGVGKSTLLRVMAGILKPLSGIVEYKGEDITVFDSRSIIQRGVSFIAQGRECFLDLTVEENIKVALLPFKLSKKDIDKRTKIALNYFKQLEENKKRLVYNLSGGIRQMLVIAMAFVQYPSCVLLDEPSIGLSESSLGQFINLIEQFKNNDKSMVIVEQKAQIIFDICDYIHFMDHGNIILSGRPSEIKENELFHKLYLGVNNN